MNHLSFLACGASPMEKYFRSANALNMASDAGHECRNTMMSMMGDPGIPLMAVLPT